MSGSIGRKLLAVSAMLALICALLSAGAAARPNRVGAVVATTKAPTVSKQPVSQTVEEGQSASFSAAASGTPTPTIQWEVSTNGGGTWSAIEGATASPLTIASASTSENGYQFRAVFKNSAGEATSKAATLTVRKPPAVTKQPASVTVEEGQNAVFEATAVGFPAPTVQWQTSANNGASWANVLGATAEQLTLASAKTSSSGHQYRAIFKNIAGSATSEAATLTVQKAPAVTEQPAGQTVDEGQNAVFEATASGFPAPTVQWELSSDGGGSWSPISGATSNQLTVPNTTTSEDGSQYRAVFTNAAGSATSQAATLTVQAPPVVTRDPTSTTVEAGEPAVFEATATGFPAPTVQWETSTNGGGSWSAIEGATATKLTIEQTVLAENGREFRAAFTNTAGKATTNFARLTVATNHYTAVAWGSNLFRQLGDGTAQALSDVPVPVSTLRFVTSVAAGGYHSLALMADATVKAWGSNSFGQLGDGTTVTREVPVTVSGLNGVRAIAAGGHHSLALMADGSVMAWGDNESGQLGTGNTIESEVPVPVKGLSGVRAIAAGGEHSLALMSNGTVMAWGDDESGQLGNGVVKPSSLVPIAVKGLTGVTAISAGGEFSLALTKAGTVEAWGSDESGQLGNVGFEESLSAVPVQVSGLSGVTAIAAGAQHALALGSGGTLMAWGEDTYGELGNGSFKARQDAAVAVSGLSGATTITAGGQDSAALLASGSVMAWGVDKSGTLGNGTTGSPSAVPVLVEGVTKVASVSAGGFHMVAYGEPIPVVTGVSPNRGPLAGGTSVTISGADLAGATAVKFGTVEASGVTVNSSSSITVTAPAGTGTVDVRVTTPAGTSPASTGDRFSYIGSPTITKLLPKSGSVAGGTSVTITGTNFTAVTAVKFGSVAASSFTVNSATTIKAVAPEEPAGSVQVSVTTEFGTTPVSSAAVYKFAPAVTAVSPNSGPVVGGTSVTVTGVGFAPGTTATKFKFGTTRVTGVSCASSTECTMTAPAHVAGTVDVTATVNKVSSAKQPPGDSFTYS
ncbi:MAG TPA: IPT/TIG domain-containing protein [Solirubrobacteraceae bacterium]|nr:IPT/TIG domain-containing protein [Solirubrobacteraceae bacterium]